MIAKPPRAQCAALPFRMSDDTIEVLLVTSRDTGRWIIPKGWLEKGTKPHDMAAREAFEEAGVVGKVQKAPVGSYTYTKRLSARKSVECKVDVFLLKVDQDLDEWPEKGQRQKEWMSPSQAALQISEDGLVEILRGLLDMRVP
jgi:8-oxo-dGTP pyrophosphatase MutT (NUDIX family)